MTKRLPSVMIFVIFGILLLIRPTGSAQATPFSKLSVEPNVSTLGFGVLFTTPLLPELDFNAGYSGFAFSFDGRADHQRYHAQFRLGGAPIYLSGYPLGPHFHVDLGFLINQNHINVTATPHGGSYTFNDHTYSVSQLGVVDGQTHYEKIAPYVGIGWGNPFSGGRWKFMANAGVVVEGGARSRILAQNPGAIPGAAADIESYETQFNHSISILTAYPVVNIGVSYRF